MTYRRDKQRNTGVDLDYAGSAIAGDMIQGVREIVLPRTPCLPEKRRSIQNSKLNHNLRSKYR